MDTSKFDTKMAELRAEEIAKANPVGRPKGPEKVVFKRRVAPEKVKQLDEMLSDQINDMPYKGQIKAVVAVQAPKVVEDLVNEKEELKSQIKLLLEDNERMTNELAAVEGRLQRVARLTDSEKLILWIRKYDALKAEYDKKVGSGEFSQ